MSKCKLFVASALTLVGALSGGVAHATHRADVQWSVTVGTPIGVPAYTQPAPVYAYPAPIYAQPAPVYTQPYPSYRGGHAYQRPYPHHRYYQEPTRWDVDGDGIPNRWDRLYNPRWDVDGDGIPNWHDRPDKTYWRGR